MSPRFQLALIALSAILCPAVVSAQVRRVAPDTATGISKAVVVTGRALIHTGQILPTAKQRDAAAQFDSVIARLKAVISGGGSSLKGLVKLNVYAANDAAAAAVWKRLPTVLAGKHQPAVCVVVTPLPTADALVAVDAVAAVEKKSTAKWALRRMNVDGVSVSIVSPGRGRLISISGQAERAKGLRMATRKTMDSLHRTLTFLKAKPEHVVQVKTFLQPMKSAADVQRVIASFYAKGKLPPVSHVEWTYGGIEIEMIAFVPYKTGESAGKPDVRFPTPPWMKTTPVFSRVAVVEGDTLIYTSGLYGRRNGSGKEQVADVFAELRQLMKKSGSDLRHLVKATYYVSDDDASKQLNALRPKFYDAKRPPAASKAGVKATGRAGRSLAIDIIAVPVGSRR